MKAPALAAESPLSAALWWLERGETPIPIMRGTKKPPKGFRWKGLQLRRPTEAEVRAWWQKWPDAQVAVLLGRTMVVIDTDGERTEAMIAEMDLPRTPTQRTPRGRHRFFSVDRPTRGRSLVLPDGSRIEIRGLGHYVLVDPSIHPSGARYEWEVQPTEPFAPLPTEVLRLFRADGGGKDGGGTATTISDASLPDHLRAALAQNRRLRDAFEGKIPPPNDKSGSGYDMVLAHECRKARLSEAEAATMISAAPFPKRHPRTAQYIRRTVVRAYAPGAVPEDKSGAYGRFPAFVVNSGPWGKLTPKATALYGVLVVRAMRPSGIVRDGRAKLVALAGLGDDSMTGALGELEEAGLIKTKRWRRGTNIWVVYHPTYAGVSTEQVRGSGRSSEEAHDPRHPHREDTGIGERERVAVSGALVQRQKERRSTSPVTSEDLHGSFAGKPETNLHRENIGMTLEDINPWEE